MTSRSAPPLAPGWPIFGSLFDMLKDPLPFLVSSYRKLGPIYRVRAAHRRFVVVAGPEANQFFMRGTGAHYLSSRKAFHRMAENTGAANLMIATDGERHQHIRQILRPAYSREMVDRHLPDVYQGVEALIRKLPLSQGIDARRVMQRLVAEQLGTAVVGRSIGDEFEDLVEFSSTYIFAIMGNLPGLRLRKPRFIRAKAALRKHVQSILNEHAAQPSVGGERTIADIVLAGKIDGQPFPQDDLVNFVTGPYMAGMDTAANTAGFLIYELLRQPALLEQVVGEIDDAFDGGPPTAQRLRSMRVLRGAYLETLRLHPVAPALPRHAAESFEFQGHWVEEGQEVLLASSVSHYLPQIFPDPERFDIERFYEPRHEDRQPGGFAPYGVGPHLCLGSGQAEIVTMVSVALLLRNARVCLDPPDYKLTTRMDPLPTAAGCRLRLLEQRGSARRRTVPDAQVALALPMLDRRLLAEVASRVAVRTYAAGTTIIRQGDEADRFYMILRGSVEVAAAGPDGQMHTLNRLTSGNYFGEIGLLGGTVRTATVRALSETSLMELERDDFMTMIADSDVTSEELARVMRERIIATGLAIALPSLKPEQAAELAVKVKNEHFPAGADIVRQGEHAAAFYVLVRGGCQVVCHGPNGGEITIARLVEGDFFGEIGLLLGVPRTATVRADDHPAGTDVLALDSETFRALVNGASLTHEEIALVMRRRLERSMTTSS